jgi:hypothetical protein
MRLAISTAGFSRETLVLATIPAAVQGLQSVLGIGLGFAPFGRHIKVAPRGIPSAKQFHLSTEC